MNFVQNYQIVQRDADGYAVIHFGGKLKKCPMKARSLLRVFSEKTMA